MNERIQAAIEGFLALLDDDRVKSGTLSVRGSDFDLYYEQSPLPQHNPPEQTWTISYLNDRPWPPNEGPESTS